MKTSGLKKSIALICFAMLSWVISGYSQNLSLSPNGMQSTENVVSNNLRQIMFDLRDTMGDSDHFPHSFSGITVPVDTNLFVCPGTGSRAGSLASIEERTDYIYAGNNTEQVPRAALIISPPENYDGKYGYVVCTGGEFFHLPPDQVRKLVEEPWLLATNTPAEIIDYMKQRVNVVVPKRFKASYPKAYSPKKLNH
ncbi:hypothetical protein [Pedosphaera parvula]|uniref:Uncharacterized protein n=1 Tax=Pedosphaera parvula (strain Ellin514) TaxID=320771 RepID=B9XBX2_PEDPL|nr:hypothetical protein [Pedosphaera parvula]EEF62440.1 hypothetical protein Cflav_PD5075 [Pedosphaera parvula Ellin514]